MAGMHEAFAARFVAPFTQRYFGERDADDQLAKAEVYAPRSTTPIEAEFVRGERQSEQLERPLGDGGEKRRHQDEMRAQIFLVDGLQHITKGWTVKLPIVGAKPGDDPNRESWAVDRVNSVTATVADLVLKRKTGAGIGQPRMRDA